MVYAFTVLVFFLGPRNILGQEIDTLSVKVSPPDSLLVSPVDSLRFLGQTDDSTSTRIGDLGDNSGSKGPIHFSSEDSLVISLGDSTRISELFGKASVKSDEYELNAGYIGLDIDSQTIRSKSGPDGGRPSFKKGEESFSGNEIQYDMENSRGRVVGSRAIFDNAYVYGHTSKQFGDSLLFIENAMYTTCDHEGDPHYHIRASKMKIVDNKWIYTGPLHIRVFNVPLPFWLPFGFIPATEGRRSGPLPPTYGEDERGFYLQDFGWYWAMNDYMDFQVKGGLWSLGSFRVNPLYRYAKRYNFSGQLGIDYVNERVGYERDPDAAKIRRNTWSFRMKHNQEISPSSKLNANVNFSTTSYLRTVARDYNSQVRQDISSNVNYSKRWSSGRSLSVSSQQRQSLTNGSVSLTLPSVSFSQRTSNPFKRAKAAGRSEAWYEKISLGYSSRLNNRYQFTRDEALDSLSEISWFEALLDGDEFARATGQMANERFDFSASHNIPINAPFSIQRLPFTDKAFRLNITPSIRYTEDWYLNSDRKSYNSSTNAVTSTTVSGFTSIRKIQGSLNANTEFYGTFPLRLGPLSGLRHIVRPTLSYSFQPDYQKAPFDYFRSYTNADGEEVFYPIRSGISAQDNSNINFGIGNVFQSRTANPDSSSSKAFRTFQLLNLDLASGYRASADSLKWQALRVTGRTRITDQLDLNFSSNFDPYQINELGRKFNAAYSNRLGLPFRLTNFSLSARTSFRSSRKSSTGQRPFSGTGDAFGSGFEANDGARDAFEAQNYNTPVGYADFSIPWSLRFDMNYTYSKSSLTAVRQATVNSSFDVSVTPKWKVQGRSGFDFIQKDVVTTSLSLLRDFHDWEMAINWIPFGRFTSFQFDIHLKTGPLKEFLRFRQPNKDIKNRFSGI